MLLLSMKDQDCGFCCSPLFVLASNCEQEQKMSAWEDEFQSSLQRPALPQNSQQQQQQQCYVIHVFILSIQYLNIWTRRRLSGILKVIQDRIFFLIFSFQNFHLKFYWDLWQLCDAYLNLLKGTCKFKNNFVEDIGLKIWSKPRVTVVKEIAAL